MYRVAVVACLLVSLSVTAAEPTRQEWKVGELTREGLIVLPTKQADGPSPVVFMFHGHGGSMKNAAQKLAIHKHWPEAICVYLQGVPTPGKLTDPEGKKNGWQHTAGDHGDRDLKFFDEVLAWLKKEHKIDEKRIYCTGHSNGGGFTYLLWAKRGDTFAAVAPSASVAARKLESDLKPKPVMHLAGEKDELVKFDWQKATMEALRKLNGCEKEGKSWGKHATEYASPKGTPVVTYIHPGTHTFPEDALPAIVKFFRTHTKQ